MPCFTTLTLSEDTGFTPLHTAVYVASTDKIVGTMENYLAEFNTTTGDFIRAVKAKSPMYGPMHICLLGAVPYLACHADRSAQHTSGVVHDHQQNDIFPVNASTLLPGTGLGIPNLHIDADYESEMGPRQFLNIGNRVYFLFPTSDLVLVAYIDSTNPLVWNSNEANYGFWTEQFCTDGTSLYLADPSDPGIYQLNANLGYVDFSGTDPGPDYFPVSTEWVSSVSKVHAVCGDQYMVRVDDFATSTNSYFDLEALIASVVTGIKPMRLRYNSVDGLVYIPVQNKDGIIVFNPLTETAVWKSGFDSPVDAVFTPTKSFAVQSGLVGIKEIT